MVLVLQWHGVLLSAGAFVAGGGPQVGVGGRVACCRQLLLVHNSR